MTLNGVIALSLRHFTEFGSFRGALRSGGASYGLRGSSPSSHKPPSNLAKALPPNLTEHFQVCQRASQTLQ